MSSILAAHAQDLPISGRDLIPPPTAARNTVILTGSTGSIGSYLLDSLLNDVSIAKIYCFNRKHQESNNERQHGIMEASGLTTNFPASRVVFVEVDLGKSRFGLSQGTYSELLRSTTHIIHNAWEVNFNLSLQSFVRPHIEGVRRFIDFSAHSKYAAHIFFLSTIGTTMHWSSVRGGEMPETIVDDWKIVQETGYAESKRSLERLLAEACRVSNVPLYHRARWPGGGPTTEQGTWNAKEWFPSLIKSSSHLGLLPGDLGPMQVVDWIPADILAQSVVELAFEANGKKAAAAGIYHLVNPNHTTYDKLVPTILSNLPNATKTVSLESWVSTLAALDRAGSPCESRGEALGLLSEPKRNASASSEHGGA